jgi:hypothetical protein
MNTYPLIQPPQIPAIITFPFELASKTISTISNSSFVKGITAMLFNELKKNSTKLTAFMADSEIKYLISQLVKDFLTFIGSIIKEVGEDATNEFLQIFFQLILNAGMKMIYGFSNVALGMLMALVGEIPIAGGIADIVITIISSFNDVIGTITPIITSSVKILTSGAHLINKMTDVAFNNPVLNNLHATFSKFTAKVFGGLSFFSFLASMFGMMKEAVSATFSGTTNYMQQSLANVSANTFGELQKQTATIDNKIQQNPDSSPEKIVSSIIGTPVNKSGGKKRKTKKKRQYLQKKYKKKQRKITYRRRNGKGK